MTRHTMRETYRRQPLVGFLVTAGTILGMTWAAMAEDPFAVEIRVDAAESLGPLRDIWRFFGADEPNYAYMKDGRKLLGQLGELQPGSVYFRAHSLLNTGPGSPALKWGSTNAYTEDENGNPVYDWTLLDLIFDTYLERGVRPYVEMAFMPKALSTRPEPYEHEWRPGMPYDWIYTGWAYPPTSYQKWEELIYQWVRHCVDRYGREEVETWYWETWNEADIPYWQGTAEEFYKLHDYSVAGVLRALPTARVGGPDTAGQTGGFVRGFYEHCLRGTNYATGKVGTRLDFASFHAKGSPSYVDGHVRMGIGPHLRRVDRGFELIASFPELRDTPIVIGESDPEGCAACQGDQLAYRNGTMYSSYTAASFARKQDLADRHGVHFLGALTWAFTFEDQAYFAGFRQLASNGLAMPVLNVFRMYSLMDGVRVPAVSSGAVALDDILRRGVRQAPDAGAFASLGTDSAAVMVWHYHDDDVPGPDADIRLAVDGLPLAEGEARLEHYRIDADHSNAYELWKRMGSPVAPDARQYRRLDEASNLARLSGSPETVSVRDHAATLAFPLPRQGVSLVRLVWGDGSR